MFDTLEQWVAPYKGLIILEQDTREQIQHYQCSYMVRIPLLTCSTPFTFEDGIEQKVSEYADFLKSYVEQLEAPPIHRYGCATRRNLEHWIAEYRKVRPKK